jgi:hypothetical protein
MNAKIKEITVMCDYCADGLWVEGAASDLESILKELEIPFDAKAESLSDSLKKWQETYENFDFWSPMANYSEVYSSDEFKDFLNEGEEIAYKVREIIPKEISIIYFKENNPQARYLVNEDKTMTLKEKYD